MLDDLFGYALALDTAPAHPSETPEDPDPALTAFFTHFAEHAGLYRSLLGPAGSARVIEHVRRRTTAAAHYSGRLTPADGTPPPDTAGPPGFPLDVPGVRRRRPHRRRRRLAAPRMPAHAAADD